MNASSIELWTGIVGIILAVLANLRTKSTAHATALSTIAEQTTQLRKWNEELRVERATLAADLLESRKQIEGERSVAAVAIAAAESRATQTETRLTLAEGRLSALWGQHEDLHRVMQSGGSYPLSVRPPPMAVAPLTWTPPGTGWSIPPGSGTEEAFAVPPPKEPTTRSRGRTRKDRA